MPNTFTQIHIQWEEDLYRYISGIVSLKGAKDAGNQWDVRSYSYADWNEATCKLSDLVREIKKSSNQFIYERGFCRFPFSWQEGYRAFSYSEGQIDGVMKYIRNQKEHHKKRSFKVEFIDILKELRIEFRVEYLFKWPEE